MSKKRNVLRNNLWMFRKIWHYTPAYVIGMILEGVIWGIHHTVSVVYVKLLADNLHEHAVFRDLAILILFYAVYVTVFRLFHHWYWDIFNPQIKEKLHIAMHADLFGQAVRLDLAKYDDPDFYNDFVWAMDQSVNHATGLMEDTGKLINRGVASLSLAGVLYTVDPLMATLILVNAAVQTAMSFVSNRISLAQQKEYTPVNRKESYLSRTFTLPDYAKELRTSHVKDNLLAELVRNSERQKELTCQYSRKWVWINVAVNGTTSCTTAAILIWIVYHIAVTETLALGGLLLAVTACWKMQWTVRDFIHRMMKYHEHGSFLEKMRVFTEEEPSVEDGMETADAFESLEIRNMGFSYPKKEETVSALEDVSLEIRRGEKIAIVGYNGAGKTTLTKLLMRLYDPTQGEIRYNGKPLRDYTVSSLRQRISAVFQDYRIFAASVAENVVGGAYDASLEADVRIALQNSTFKEKSETLPNGLDTQLTREFDPEGTQLSGGEAQKIAIARAFYRHADLMILDEPSSALDPDAEYHLNRAIADYAKDKTVIFISHRLSTTRHADRIYMFDNGKLIESGSHDELMEKAGPYAYMFNLQAEKYRNQTT